MKPALLLLAALLVTAIPAAAQTNTVAKVASNSRFAAELKPYDDKINDTLEELNRIRNRAAKKNKDIILQVTELNRKLADLRRERRLKEIELIRAERGGGSSSSRPAPRPKPPTEKPVR